MNKSPQSRSNVRVIISCVAIAAGIVAAIAWALLFAERRAKLKSPIDYQSTSAPQIIQSKVSIEPTPNWKFTTLSLAHGGSLKEIQMVNRSVGFMIAYPHELYRTLNAAKTWEPIDLKLPARGYLTDLFFVSPDLGWLAVSKTELDFDSSSGKGAYDDATWIFETRDSGKNWAETLSLEGAQITQIQFVDDKEGWASGRRFSKQAPFRDTNLLLQTNDRGQNWIDLSKKLSESGTGVDHLYPAGPSKALLLTLNGLIYRTTDAGQSWRDDGAYQDQHQQTAIRRLGVSQAGRLWMVGGTSGLEGTWSILAMKDTNGNWVRHEIGGIDLNDAVFLSEDHILACGSISSDNTAASRQAAILYSIDRGKNWVIAYRNAGFPGLNALAILDSQHILVVGERGLILKIEIS